MSFESVVRRAAEPPVMAWLAVAVALAALLASGCDGDDGVVADARDDEGFGVDTPAYAPLPDGVDLDAPFEALFCPDDPVVTLELALIDRVRAAFADDGGAYAEGANPFRIRYAVYNLRNPEIVDALVAAHDDGVDVQVLIDADQLDPERTWNWADEHLIDAGFEFVADHRDLDEAGRVSADLIGIDGSGLMHLKARLYETPAGTTLLTGSMNPGDNAIHNDETLHLVNLPELVAPYAAAYDAVLADGPLDNAWDDAAPVNVLFAPEASGPRAGAKILEWVADEDEQILLMVYSLRDVAAPGWSDSLVDVIAERVAAGVPVHIITDRKQSDGYWDTTEDRLRDAGARVWEVTNETTPYTAMHHKVAVLGRTDIRVITDAANWTRSGLGDDDETASNVESALFIDTEALDGGRTGRRYLAQWLRVLQRYDYQLEDDGEPGYDAVFAGLTGEPDWPTIDVSVTALGAETRWGELVYVRGDQPALGMWGFEGWGLPLWTDADSYPIWTTDAPAALPVGAPFEWKLVATDVTTGETRWESGGNRLSRAQPPALIPADGLDLVASWR